jgi:hypothetical protein
MCAILGSQFLFSMVFCFPCKLGNYCIFLFECSTRPDFYRKKNEFDSAATSYKHNNVRLKEKVIQVLRVMSKHGSSLHKLEDYKR